MEYQKPRIAQIPIGLLNVDSRVQRSLDPLRANRIANELELSAIGILGVSERADGTYWLFDGQHRKHGLLSAGYDENYAVECEVYLGLSIADEAAMFRLRNNTKSATYLDKFRVRVVEGDRAAVSITALLQRHGWVLGAAKYNQPGCLTAIAALEKIFLVDPVAAERAIATVTRTWGHEPNGVHNALVEGFGLFYIRYAGAVDIDSLVDKLQKSAGPAKLVGMARGQREARGKPVAYNVAEILVTTYNKSLRSRALPDWRQQPR